MHERPPQNENSEEKIEKEKTPLSLEEKTEWLDGMEEFRQELEKEVKRLKEEINDMEDNEERQEKEVLIHELEEQVDGMKDFVEDGRNPEEDLYRVKETPDDIEV